jgi:hypothetical protein
MMDEDDTVKELAIKTIEELWFPTTSATTVNTRTKSASVDHNRSDKNSILAKVIVIMGTAAHFKERQSPLEDLLHKIMAEKPENEVPALHTRYSEICETLIDGLVDAADISGFVSSNLCHRFMLTADLVDRRLSIVYGRFIYSLQHIHRCSLVQTRRHCFRTSKVLQRSVNTDTLVTISSNINCRVKN